MVYARGENAGGVEIDETRVTFGGTAYIVDPSVPKGAPVETRRIYVHSADEIPKLPEPTEDAPADPQPGKFEGHTVFPPPRVQGPPRGVDPSEW